VDSSQITGIVVCIFMVLLSVRWWFTAKEAVSKKYILALGICWLVMGISYSIGKLFDITALRGVMGLTGILAFLGMIYFLIRAILSERKAKKEQPDD
jgi:apolipoprotein N-acyltransferase